MIGGFYHAELTTDTVTGLQDLCCVGHAPQNKRGWRVARALRDFEFVGGPSFGVGRAGVLSLLSRIEREKS